MLSVIGKVNARLVEKLQTESGAPYHGETLEFTSVSSKAPTVFPTLSVVSIGEPTTGEDLSGIVQPGIISSIELSSYTDTSLHDATELLDYASDVMQSMGYQLVYGQFTVSDVEPFCKTCRFRRIVGSGDYLY